MDTLEKLRHSTSLPNLNLESVTSLSEENMLDTESNLLNVHQEEVRTSQTSPTSVYTPVNIIDALDEESVKNLLTELHLNGSDTSNEGSIESSPVEANRRSLHDARRMSKDILAALSVNLIQQWILALAVVNFDLDIGPGNLVVL
jgi:hypothetical protein